MSSRAKLLFLSLAVFANAGPLGAQHRFIANERNQLFIFDKQGQVQWRHKIKGAPHDIHQLTNGNILTHQGTELIEISVADKAIVWSFDARQLAKAQRVEVHSLQPLGEGRIMVALSGEGKIFEIDRKGKVLHTIDLLRDNPHPHRDTRLVRRLKNGNYLVAQEGDGAVREYQPDGTLIWEYRVPLFGKNRKNGHGPEAFGNAVFSAVRLSNGNTLIGTGNGHSVLEVNHQKEIVWQIHQNDLRGIRLAWVTTLEVLPNGNIVVGNCHAGPGQPQLIEITKDKKVVWKFTNFEALGNNVSNSLLLDVNNAIR